MLLLCGNIGSGKSTLCKEFPELQRVCQDVIGNRNDCITYVKRHFNEGKSVIIDRTNISKKQRKYFIDVAKEYNVNVHCIYLESTVVESVERVKNRENHETIKNLSEEKIKEIYNKFDSELEPPTQSEGIDKILYIQCDHYHVAISNVIPSFREEINKDCNT